MDAEERIKQWFDRKYMEWSGGQPRNKRSFTAFAEWLGVSRNTANNWTLRGESPTGKNLELVAAKLGPEIYDVLGLPRPDPLLQDIIRWWPYAPDKVKREVAERVGGYAPDDSGERRPAGKRDRRVERSE